MASEHQNFKWFQDSPASGVNWNARAQLRQCQVVLGLRLLPLTFVFCHPTPFFLGTENTTSQEPSSKSSTYHCNPLVSLCEFVDRCGERSSGQETPILQFPRSNHRKKAGPGSKDIGDKAWRDFALLCEVKKIVENVQMVQASKPHYLLESRYIVTVFLFQAVDKHKQALHVVLGDHFFASRGQIELSCHGCSVHLLARPFTRLYTAVNGKQQVDLTEVLRQVRGASDGKRDGSLF